MKRHSDQLFNHQRMYECTDIVFSLSIAGFFCLILVSIYCIMYMYIEPTLLSLHYHRSMTALRINHKNI